MKQTPKFQEKELWECYKEPRRNSSHQSKKTEEIVEGIDQKNHTRNILIELTKGVGYHISSKNCGKISLGY